MNVRLAVSLDDLERVPDEVRASMLTGRLDLEHPVQHAGDPRKEPVTALVFCCDLLDAASIVDVLRSWDAQNGDESTRAYVQNDESGAAWRKIPGHVQLTLVVNDVVVVNQVALAIRNESTSASRDVAETIALTASRQTTNRPRPRIVG